MHDSATTMLMRGKMAGINGVRIGPIRCIYTYCALQNPDQNITLKQTYDINRQRHRTPHKRRGSLRLAPIKR